MSITQSGSNYGLVADTSSGVGNALHGIAGVGRILVGSTAGSTMMNLTDANGSCTVASLTGLVCNSGNPVNSINYIASETGANNAIAGTLIYAVGVSGGLTVQIQLAHTLQAGVNTFNYAGSGAVAIKSCRNPANNIATAYAATGTITLSYNATNSIWCDVSQ